MIDYLRDPDAIYARSFATIRAEADLRGLGEDMQDVAVRMNHACMPAGIQAASRSRHGISPV